MQIIEGARFPIKAWIDGVPVEDEARKQLHNIANLPFIFKHVAVMPDVHLGKGATIGSVIATKGAVVPSAVGVDLGCGVVAHRTSLMAHHLPDDLAPMRAAIEKAIPHGRTDNGGKNDRGVWENPPEIVVNAALEFAQVFSDLRYAESVQNMDSLMERMTRQLGSLGTGNHFAEVCLDEENRVWLMLHSGSRGIGNIIASHYIERAKKFAATYFYEQWLSDAELAWLPEGTPDFDDYVTAIGVAQDYAFANRELMMIAMLGAVSKSLGDGISLEGGDHVKIVNCHHNYLARERHFGQNVLVTRKGAVRAQEGDMGIIPGSMGAKSFIVRGKGNRESFMSCSHGAGRKMSRNEAKKRFTIADHAKATEGVECRKDESVLDETPGAYKSIEDVMAAQSDLVEIVHTLKAILCVKG